MKIEFVEFYPHIVSKEAKGRKNKNYIGTVHVYLIDAQLDIRGINVYRNKDSFKFSLPFRVAFSADTGELGRYPCISFTDPKKHKELMDFLHQVAEPAIKQHLQPPGCVKKV
jgi:hypothetical protein